jgi:hypothetical protein
MKTNTILLLCLLSNQLILCQSDKIGEMSVLNGKSYIDVKFLPFIDTFLVDDTCKNCSYYMFVDKISENKTMIVLEEYEKNFAAPRNDNPLLGINYRGRIFKIICGIENIVYNKTKSKPIESARSDKRQFHYYRSSSIIIKNDQIKLYKNINLHPFDPTFFEVEDDSSHFKLPPAVN